MIAPRRVAAILSAVAVLGGTGWSAWSGSSHDAKSADLNAVAIASSADPTATDEAFAKLPKSTLTAVAKDPVLLQKVLTYHVVKGKAPAAKVVTLNGKSVKTLEGQAVKISIRGGKVYLNGSTRVTKTNVMASNGVIHVIDRVLIPTS